MMTAVGGSLEGEIKKIGSRSFARSWTLLWRRFRGSASLLPQFTFTALRSAN